MMRVARELVEGIGASFELFYIGDTVVVGIGVVGGGSFVLKRSEVADAPGVERRELRVRKRTTYLWQICSADYLPDTPQGIEFVRPVRRA